MTATSQRQSVRPSITEQARAKALSRVRDARLALSEPASVIAQRARARYEQADKAIRLPSKKPRIVANPKREHSLIWAMRIFAVGVVVSLLVVVGIQTTIAKRQITIDELRTAQKKEITKFEKNRHEVAKLRSPDRITRRAAHLGLVQPARFVSVSIPMEIAARSDLRDDQLWREVKAIVNATS